MGIGMIYLPVDNGSVKNCDGCCNSSVSDVVPNHVQCRKLFGELGVFSHMILGEKDEPIQFLNVFPKEGFYCSFWKSK